MRVTLRWAAGVVLAAVLMLLVLSGCSASSEAKDTPVGELPTAELATPTPAGGRPTPDGEEVIGPVEETPAPPEITPTPEIYDYSVLTPAQRERLYQVSLTFLAETEADAIRVAEDLNYVDKWGHPATFCGPLAIGILQRAGLLDRTVDLHDFWLLNPRDEFTVSQILEKTFPREDYYWYQTVTPLNQFDFHEFPLYTGDFLYLYAGPGGTFEHMLTVTRVDDRGRVYAVSAELYTGEYAISEVMLYDPNDPDVGFFHDLTDRSNMYTIGLTGFGGFQLWRPNTPIADLQASEQAFQNSLDAVFEASGGEWHVLVKAVGGETLYALHENSVIHPGSVIKVPLAMLFLASLHQREIIDLPEFLNERGIDGRTYDQLLRAMLVASEEEATETLYEFTRSQINLQATLKDWGFVKTVISPRETTAAEMANLFEDLWTERQLSDVESEIVWGYLEEYTPGDDGRIGVIRQAMPEDAHFFSKRGSLADGRVIVAEVAVVEVGGQAYILSLFGYPNKGESQPTYEVLEDTIEAAAWVIWDYIEDLP